MRYSRNNQRPGKAPRFKEEKEPPRNVRKYCPECCQHQPASHLCNPRCLRCSSAYGAGNSTCDRTCGLFPCCGCCNETLNNADPPTEIDQQEEDQQEGSEIRFPDLQFTLHQLCDFLFSEIPVKIEIERAIYKHVIQDIGGKEAFIHLLLNTISPDIRALKGQSITPQVLHAIREKQMTSSETWKDLYGGYLDFVTQLEPPDPTYLRFYIGQSCKPRLRISEHIRKISKASKEFLHYFIISGCQGGVTRQANFIRLWTIPFPPGIDETVKTVFENCLEMTICRAFQSLPSFTLKEVFGPCPNSADYSGVGLNVMSPLVQGQYLSSKIQEDALELLLKSPDPEICEFPDVRKKQKHQREETSKSQDLPIRPHMRKQDYRNALQNAVRNVEGDLVSENTIWGPLAVQSPMVDTQCWFQSTVAKLRHNNPRFDTETEASFISPIGSPESLIGIVFENTPLHDYEDEGKVLSIPWGLRESGFQVSNSLVWPFNLQRYQEIPRSLSIQPRSDSDYTILSEATQELITGSNLRVIIICGDIEDAIVPTSTKETVLVLSNRKFKVWVEVHQGQIARFFIKAPIPLSKLWVKHGRQAHDFTSIFKFVSAVTDLEGFPSFFELALCHSLIIREWANEKNGKIAPIANLQDLAPVLKVYMADRGVDETGLRQLMEATGGSLRRGILLFLVASSRTERKAPHNQRLRQLKTETTGATATPKGMFDKVRAIYHDLIANHQAKRLEAYYCMQNTTASTTASFVQQETQVSDTEGLLLEDIDKLDLDDVEPQGMTASEFEIDDAESQEKLPTVSEFDIRNRERTMARLISFGSGLKLLVGQEKRVYGRFRGSFSIAKCSIAFDKGPGRADVEFFWVKFELSPIGTKHLRVWATGTRQQDDPGARLAIKIYLQDENGSISWETYPTSDTRESACQANSLVDRFSGTSFRELSDTPRRFINMDKRLNLQLDAYPRLKRFIGGAYTADSYVDDNLEVVPSQGPNRGTTVERVKSLKRKQPA